MEPREAVNTLFTELRRYEGGSKMSMSELDCKMGEMKPLTEQEQQQEHLAHTCLMYHTYLKELTKTCGLIGNYRELHCAIDDFFTVFPNLDEVEIRRRDCTESARICFPWRASVTINDITFFTLLSSDDLRKLVNDGTYTKEEILAALPGVEYRPPEERIFG